MINFILNNKLLTIIFIISQVYSAGCQTTWLITADRLWDGKELHKDWAVLVEGNLIKEVGPISSFTVSEQYNLKELGNSTILPGMIEGHSHMLLHPYDEVSWNDQVLKESIAERVIRGAKHAEATLMAGFTTSRDLGSEGAGYADVGLKQSIEKGLISGPRLLVAGPAIVATGSYGPKGFAEQVHVPLGAIEADGVDALIAEVRRQIGGGADLIKVYADYRWGPSGEAMPTFSLAELKLVVEVAESSGRKIVAHASTAEAMRRATLAGISTIEHGDDGTPEVFQLMKEHDVALCPTLAAGDAISQYRGWHKGVDPEPMRISHKKRTFKQALEAGVTIVAGGDVGVFPHGDNVRELEMMVEYGMTPRQVLTSVTSTNADVFGWGDRIGQLKEGYVADIIAVKGNPLEEIDNLRKVFWIMKEGILISKN